MSMGVGASRRGTPVRGQEIVLALCNKPGEPMMNILFLGRDLRIGGGTTFRLNVSRGLMARGHDVWVAGQPGEMARRLSEAGVHPLRVLPSPFNRWQLRHVVR